uniref:Uncharacterized protein n=1 Tax=viral metagenome TaxID=1070528 RepID=A0A6M3LC10_9ZZZZ
MAYCSVDDVYRISGITSSEVSRDDVKEHILDAEAEVDRVTNTTFWSLEDSGTATAGGSTTITDSTAKFGTDRELVGSYVWIYGGTGINQLVKISSHTNTVITVDTAWTTNPSTDSTYRIIHTSQDPRISASLSGNDTDTLFLRQYPTRRINSVTIDSTSVTTSTLIREDEMGKIILTSSSEKTTWVSKKANLNVIDYWYGVYELPREILKLTAMKAALTVLAEQTGGTFNVPSTYSLPEGSVTIGQAYVNIREAINSIQKQHDKLEQRVRKYPYFA